MKSIVHFLYLFFVHVLGTCAQVTGDPQAAASKQIKDWQNQYNQYIFKTLANRTSGCTTDKLQIRREWQVMAERREILDRTLTRYTLQGLAAPTATHRLYEGSPMPPEET